MERGMLKILLVDDEPSLRLSVGDALVDAGHAVTRAADGQAAVERLEVEDFDLIVSDIRMPRMDGVALFEWTREHAPRTDFILVTAYGAVEDAVKALKAGASDYITKPFDVGELITRVSRIAERRALTDALVQARAQLDASPAVEIIGASLPLRQMLARVDIIAKSDARVLVLGESGTGKELVARRLHAHSGRAAGPFVAVHCAAFPETLIESELFGHARGAYTGANVSRSGRFVRANGGTLFLDEIAEVSLAVQAKLLRVLQEGVVDPLGAERGIQVDVRVICATHRDLRAMVEDGSFREDLYYRLNVIDVEVPPLRMRTGDLTLLVERFRRRFCGDGPVPEISVLAWSALEAYPFPGNVRELEHAIQHATILCGAGPILPMHLPRTIAGDLATALDESSPITGLGDAVKAFERAYLQRVLHAMDGKKTQAAEALGISRKNLWEKLKGHGLD